MKNYNKILFVIIATIITISMTSFHSASSLFDAKYLEMSKLQLFKKNGPTSTGIIIGDSRQKAISNLGQPSSSTSFYSDIYEKTVYVDHYGNTFNQLHYIDNELVEIEILRFSDCTITIGSSSQKLSNNSSYLALYGALKDPTQSSFVVTEGSDILDMNAVFFYKSVNGSITEIKGFNIAYY